MRKTIAAIPLLDDAVVTTHTHCPQHTDMSHLIQVYILGIPTYVALQLFWNTAPD